MLKRIDAAIVAGETLGVADATHAIKGAALGIGARQLAARCAIVDDAAAAGQSERLHSAVADLHKCFEETAVQVNEYSARKLRASR